MSRCDCESCEDNLAEDRAYYRKLQEQKARIVADGLRRIGIAVAVWSGMALVRREYVENQEQSMGIRARLRESLVFETDAAARAHKEVLDLITENKRICDELKKLRERGQRRDLLRKWRQRHSFHDTWFYDRLLYRWMHISWVYQKIDGRFLTIEERHAEINDILPHQFQTILYDTETQINGPRKSLP